MIRSLLASNLETPRFWEQVDALTLQLITLLLPLINLMDTNFERSRARSLRVMYQELHYLVSQAAFLSLGIRWSHDIFRFEWAIPGLPFDKEQQNVDQWVYDRSRDRARRADEREEEQQPPEVEAREYDDINWFPHDLLPSADAVLRFGANIRDMVWRKLVSIALAGQDPESIKARRERIRQPTRHQTPLRMAKVHIVTWPALVRHEVVGEPGKHPLTGHLDTEGERITIIMKAPVVYYSGLEGSHGDHAERIPTLEEYVLSKRLERTWKKLARWVVGVVLLSIVWLTVMAVAGSYFPALRATLRTIKYLAEGAVRTVMRQISLWVLEVLGNLVRVAVGASKVFSFLSYAVKNTLAEWTGRPRPAGGPSWPVSHGTLDQQSGVPGWLPIWWWWSSPTHQFSSQGGGGTAEEVGYPRLDLETFKILAKVVYNEASWKTYDDSFQMGNIGQTAADWWASST